MTVSEVHRIDIIAGDAAGNLSDKNENSNAIEKNLYGGTNGKTRISCGVSSEHQ